MVNVKNNARFLATDQRIEVAALALMDDSDAARSISVAAVCRKAGINRSTFYEHFIDLDDMFAAMQEYLNAELAEQFQRADMHEPLSENSLRIYLSHIRQHRYFYRITLKHSHRLPLDLGGEELWKQRIRPAGERIGITSDNELVYFRDALLSSFSAVLQRWIANDCADDIERITLIVANIIPLGIAEI
ncbi:TetR/AcrR family transcriptional regulator [Bifidobacterium oedipodis]|uniref:Transcriptional regulator, TetR family n=1 Tax=Bifidobacterium oedipodis TaxID=2675322 RepID=A0A7Y0ES94_9BIFI|nr:TetR/AcrR family transcriptional regulator [Bifidobacterium sp. DSM 109957]NMM94391.1 transcriptional regulator, TetR family [Bifidobacterium sp. DSM 109957]